jgi:uncharacterized membrane protein (Fun14 family)
MNVADYAPLAGTVGGGFAAGALAGYAIKQVMRIAAVIVGLFIAVLAYLEYQKIINVYWARAESVSQSSVTWVVDALTLVSNNIGAPHTASLSLGISTIVPLTSSVSAGFMLGLARG